MSLCAIIYSKIRRITSVDMIQIVIVGNQIYSSLSLLVRQSMLMFATALRVGDMKYLILKLEICMVTVIVKGHVYCWKLNPCINEYNIFRVYMGMRIYMSLKVYILPTLKFIFFQAVLNSVVYQMLMVTNVPVNSAGL